MARPIIKTIKFAKQKQGCFSNRANKKLRSWLDSRASRGWWISILTFEIALNLPLPQIKQMNLFFLLPSGRKAHLLNQQGYDFPFQVILLS